MSLNLPKIHALTGCDTTSYFYRVGKTEVFKKSLGQQDLYSQITNSVIEDIKEFIRTVLYNGNKKESYVNTKVKLYKGLKQKSILTLPPDPDCVTKAIKRVNLQDIVAVFKPKYDIPIF